MKTTIVNVDGLDCVETEDGAYGLGLQMPKAKTLIFPTLATMSPLLQFADIRKIVESVDFHFGRKLFDGTWTTDQNGYGSCAGYGGASAASKSRVVGGQSRVDLSGDYLYSWVNGGRDQGALLDDCMNALLKHGCATKQTVPRGAIYRNKYNAAVADAEADRALGHELYAVPDEQSMATALALHIPVVMAIHVGNRWQQFDSDNILAPSHGPGNHCEHLDDIVWSAKRGCFLYRKCTSHSRNYNPSHYGYCWTTWEDHYKTTSQYHVFYAVPSMKQDPQGDNPPVPR